MRHGTQGVDEAWEEMRVHLVADIGGTWSRLAWRNQCSDPPRMVRLSNRDYPSLGALLARGCERLGLEPAAVGQLILALPAPVTPGTECIPLTNIAWTASRSELQTLFPAARIRLVNDFQAAALGVLPPARAEPLQQGHSGPDHAVVVTGPGTGLGLAWIADARQPDLPHATEGGHSGFAPETASQRALAEWLGTKFAFVSWERVVSGPGLAWIHAFLARQQEPKVETPEILRMAEAGDEAAMDSIRLWLSCLAAWVGNLALLFKPGGGIYLTGGMTQHVARWLDADFIDRINQRGVMSDVVRQTPIYRSLVEEPGIQGALALACLPKEDDDP